MATVYLHIGLPKTGTSSLQNFLSSEKNQEILAKHGICFPVKDYGYMRISIYRNGHFLVVSDKDLAMQVRKQLGEQSAQKIYNNGLDQLSELAEQYDRILLSDESIWKRGHAHPGFWCRLKEDLQKRNLAVRIIVYLRRQDLWMESYYAQKVKEGRTGDRLDAFIKGLENVGYPLDYYQYIDELASLFGKENLDIRIFEKTQFCGAEHTIYSDFLDIFGLSMENGFEIGLERYNVKYEGDLLEARRILNSLPEYQHPWHPLKDPFNLLHSMQTINAGTKYAYFDEREREAFLDLFAESNRKLAVEYLGREDGALFYETTPKLPVYQADSYELIRSIALVYAKEFTNIAARNQKLEKEIADLRESLLSTRVKKKVNHLFGRDRDKKL